LLLVEDLEVAAQVGLPPTAVLVDPVVAQAEEGLPVQLQTLVQECNQTYQECLDLLVTEIAAEIIHSLLVTQVQAVAVQVELVQTAVLVELLRAAQGGQVLSPGLRLSMPVAEVVVVVVLQTQQVLQVVLEAEVLAVMRLVTEAD
jgi:hypothetical protein